MASVKYFNESINFYSSNIVIAFLFYIFSIITLLGSGINIKFGDYAWFGFAFAILLCLVKELRLLIFKDSSDFTYLPLLFLFFLLICLEPLQYLSLNGYLPYWDFMHIPTETAKLVSVSILAFFIASVYLLKPNRSIDNPEIKVIKKPLEIRFIVICLVLFVLGLIPYITAGKSILIMLFAGRSNSGFSQFDIVGLGNTNFLPFFANFLIGVCLFTGYFLIIKNEKSTFFSVSCLLLFLTSAVFIVSGGGRTRLGFVIVPLMMMYFLYNKDSAIKIIIGAVFVFLVLALISFMVQMRTKDFTESNNETDDVVLIDLSGSNLNREVLFIGDYYYDQPIACNIWIECLMLPYIDTLNKFITNPVPRAIWSHKYLDPSFANYNLVRTGATGFEQTSNVTATSFGRYYILYGLPGVLAISFIFSALLRVLSNNFVTKTDYFDVIFLFQIAYYLGQSVRDFNPGWLYPVLFTFVCKKILEFKAMY